ncbi:MAG TPA: fibronectin type III domain-containing protein [Thermoanaerobaculia bacterium]|nr:fibronectin type III domain-containing protein [Thermoanaerobaculia bacterium]
MNVRSCRITAILPLIGLLALPALPANAQVIKEAADDLDALAYSADVLVAQPVMEQVEDAQSLLEPTVRDGWHAFRGANGDWKAQVDKRHGRVDFAEGAGVPWVPGRGNGLKAEDIAGHLKGKKKADLSTLESISGSFLPKVAHLLGVDVKSLKLDKDRSGNPSDYLWYLDYNVEIDGLAVEGARVVFRINHGNLIQFGSENLPSPKASAPKAKLTREQALSVLAAYVGGMRAGDTFLDNGSLRLLPVAIEDVRFNDKFEFGKGRGLAAAWQFTFNRAGEGATWRGRIDAASGEVLDFRDINEYAQATGSVKFLGVPQSGMPMPFANLSSGGFTNSAGVYTFPGGTVTSTLAGQFVRVLDNCGAISLAANGSGDLLFGGTTGTDCTTPGVGGAGNTFSARGQFYHVNRAKEIARGWITRPWLTAQLTANVNINQTCNAFWNGSTINFYRSGGGCGNTGEIEGVSLHEYGHGLDTNDGNGSSPDNGTGETYGDFTAALATHTSCVGSGFLGSNCGGYGDACTACTGVRDIDWAKRVSNTPHTVANFTQPRCPTSLTYRGPCGREGHCESYISSEALWDLANRDLPSPGSGAAWATVDRLWYLSRSTATAAFACTASGTWTSNGCNTGSLWKTMRAVDDDDGNLANGTPHSANLFAAFNRHGIACTTDAGANTNFRGCAQPAVPAISLTAGNNQATVSWSGSTGVFDVYRSERGCNAGFTKIANDVSGSSFVDSQVANGRTYHYQVTAQPSGNEACASAPSTCSPVVPAGAPCTPPAAPTGLTATAAGQTQINLSWSAVSGATEYHILRSATSGGPYTQVGTSATTSFSNTGLTCNTPYFYVVRAANSATCESGNSNQASATTSVCTGCTTTTLYTNGFETGTGLSNWTRGSFGGNGTTATWRGIQTCTAKTGTKIFRYGGTSCTADYTSNNFNFAQPNGAAGITVPAGSNTTRLSFWHRRAFETGYDGGTLTISVDGANYFFIPASAILSGTTYNGTLAADCAPAGAAGASIFTGNSTTFTNTTVNLDAACNAATGGTGGCAGLPVRIGFTTMTDCSVTGDGWFLDDVTVTACQ